MKLLDGKTAVITGCNRGIGRATLETFAENGANVFACVRNLSDEFNAYADELSTKYSVKIMPIVFDLCDEVAMKEAVGEIRKTRLPVEILVNNAGIISPHTLFQMISLENTKNIFEVNFFAQMRLTQYISRLMQRNGKGSIIYLSSIAGLDGLPGQFEYCGTKAAIAGVTKTLAKEFGANNIRVNAVAPGIISTDMGSEVDNEFVQNMIARSALRRIGQPKEVSKVILFLASDLSNYVTGQIIRIDGGM